MVAATTKTAAYPKATNPDCVRKEMDFTRAFYRPHGQGHAIVSLSGTKSSICGASRVPATFRESRFSGLGNLKMIARCSCGASVIGKNSLHLGGVYSL